MKIVMAHTGTKMFRKEAAALLKYNPNLYIDLAGSGSWQSVTALELKELLSGSTCQVGNDAYFSRLVLGSDAYVSKPEIMLESQKWYMMHIEQLGLNETVKDLIMGNTTSGWIYGH